MVQVHLPQPDVRHRANAGAASSALSVLLGTANPVPISSGTPVASARLRGRTCELL